MKIDNFKVHEIIYKFKHHDLWPQSLSSTRKFGNSNRSLDQMDTKIRKKFRTLRAHIYTILITELISLIISNPPTIKNLKDRPVHLDDCSPYLHFQA